MKLVATGDLHNRRKDLSELRQFVYPQLLKAVQASDGLILLGDNFDSDRPYPDEVDCFIEFIKSIPEDKKIYVIEGNHDNAGQGVVATMWLPKVVTKNIEYHDKCLSFTIEGHRILMVHTNVAESATGPQDKKLSGKSCKEYGDWDILLLGHIHKSQVVQKSKPLTIHPGSPLYYNFGERLDAKGYYLLDLQPHRVQYSFQPLKVIPMHQVVVNDFNLSKLRSSLDLLDPLSKVKVVFQLSHYNIKTLRFITKIIHRYKKRYHTFEYEKATTINKELSSSSNNKQTNVPDLLEKFCDLEKLDESTRQAMRNLIL